MIACLVAAVIDVRSFRIPNWLTFTAAGAGLVLNTLLFGVALGGNAALRFGLASVVGCITLLLAFGLLAAMRFVTMGDVKLMAAVGALLRFPDALWALAYVAIAGGVLGVGYALVLGRMGRVVTNLFRIARRVVTRRPDEVELHRIPYSLAILVGATWAALLKYWPVLRIP